MDALSLMLRTTRARSPLVADIRLGNDVSIGVPSLSGLPFHYVVRGTCRLDTGDERILLNAGDFVMLARLPYYRFETGDGARRFEVMDFAEKDNFATGDLRAGRDHFLVREFGDLPTDVRIFSAIVMTGGREDSPLTRDLPVVTLLRDMRALLEPWVIAALEFMSIESRASEPGRSAIAERLIEVLFIAVLQKWLVEGRHERGWLRGLADPTVSRVLSAMHAAPGRHWTLRDLAAKSGRSRSGLAKHFREVMDETPFAYLKRWRMHLATSMVARGERSLVDIAVGLGYSDATTFSRAFLEAFGETPAQYGRRCRKEAADSDF